MFITFCFILTAVHIGFGTPNYPKLLIAAGIKSFF
jgi:hypothetical protein